MRLVPHNNVVALAIAPSVWLGYFVITFFISALGCERGWYDVRIAGIGSLQLALWVTAAVGAVLILFASWESWLHWRAAQDPREDMEPEERDRLSFLSKAGLFLCGISLLGIVWGTFNMLIFKSCVE